MRSYRGYKPRLPYIKAFVEYPGVDGKSNLSDSWFRLGDGEVAVILNPNNTVPIGDFNYQPISDEPLGDWIYLTNRTAEFPLVRLKEGEFRRLVNLKEQGKIAKKEHPVSYSDRQLYL